MTPATNTAQPKMFGIMERQVNAGHIRIEYKRVMNFEQMSDEQLMGRLQEGDAAALEALYQRYSRRLLAYLMRMLGDDRETAEDFLQDIFLKMYRQPGLFQRSQRFSSWIFTVAHHRCISEYRRRHTRRNTQAAPDMDVYTADDARQGAVLDSDFDRKQFNRELHRELEKTDEQRRSIFLLRHQEQFSIREIAHMLDCPEGTVKSSLFYLTKKLAKALQHFHISQM